MAHTNSLSKKILDQLRESIKALLIDMMAVDLIVCEEFAVAESFPVWELDVDQTIYTLNEGGDLLALASATHVWHHQVECDGNQILFARSELRPDGNREVSELFRSPLAIHVALAIKWIDKNIAFDPFTCLLSIPLIRAYAFLIEYKLATDQTCSSIRKVVMVNNTGASDSDFFNVLDSNELADAIRARTPADLLKGDTSWFNFSNNKEESEQQNRNTPNDNELQKDAKHHHKEAIRLSINPPNVIGGKSCKCVVRIGEAKTMPVDVRVSSERRSLFKQIPKAVFIRPGATSVTFTITTQKVSIPSTVRLTVELGSSKHSVKLTVLPGPSNFDGENNFDVDGPGPSNGKPMIITRQKQQTLLQLQRLQNRGLRDRKLTRKPRRRKVAQ